LVVNPSVDVNLGQRIAAKEAKEESILLKKFGPKPLLAFFAKRSTLSLLWPSRILRDHIERQFNDGGRSI